LALKPRRPINIVHTSDVHLETDSFGNGPNAEALRDRVRRSFSEVIEIANQREADLLLIVGDLFDSARVSEAALHFALAEIRRAKMPVVMIPGNHDAHDEASIYASLNPDSLPGNLHLILEPDGTVLDFPHLETRIWGRALVEHSPDYRPLGGMPAPAADRWNIAMAHGFFTEDADGMRSSPITPDEIEASAYDYIALGHIHVFGDVSQGPTRAAYCGTPAPLYASDNAGWVAWISCVPGEPVRLERLPVKP
jgi:DNA repair exonuclease SbcCD nuclease subunit